MALPHCPHCHVQWWLGGVEQRSRVVVRGTGYRADVGGHEDGGG